MLRRSTLILGALLLGPAPASAATCFIAADGSCVPAMHDDNSSSYSSWATLTPGGSTAGLRGIAAHCTVAGTATLTDGGGNTMAWDLGVGFQQQPFVPATGPNAVTGCTFYGLK